MKSPTETVVEAIAVTAELTQTPMSGGAMTVLARDLLQHYPAESVLRALDRCRRELKRKLCQADIEGFLQEADGRPGGDVAWSIALQMLDEAATVVTNAEIAEALALARPVLEVGDKIGARRTFLDAYDQRTRLAREQRAPAPTWYPSLGADPNGRAPAIEQAVQRGLLTTTQATHYLPAPISAADAQRGQALLAAVVGKTVALPPGDPEFKARIAGLRDVLRGRA